jgi:hypothetical protein
LIWAAADVADSRVMAHAAAHAARTARYLMAIRPPLNPVGTNGRRHRG